MKKVLGLLGRVFQVQKKERRITPWDYERQVFENEARKQFLKLKEKGLPIPIMTL